MKSIQEIKEMHPYKQPGNPDSYSRYNEGWSDACDVMGQESKRLLKMIMLMHLIDVYESGEPKASVEEIIDTWNEVKKFIKE